MSIGVKIEAQYEQFVSATAALKDVFSGAMEGMKDALKEMSDEAKVAMKGHESATEQFANILKNNFKGVTGAVEGVKIAWAQLAVVFAGARFLGEAVSDTVRMTTEAQKLGRSLGTSATEASYLSVAIGDVHGTTDQFLALSKGMTTQLGKHELAMNKMGLETRDANGDLKDQQTLILDAMEVLRGYKEGTDRNIAAQALFGKGINVSSEMLSLNAEKMAEAKEKADALGLAVGEDDVEASNKFRAAMGDMHDIIDAVMKTIGSALLPVLNDLGEWFTSYGPQALLAIKVALDIVISLFKGLALAVKVLWEVVQFGFKSMVDSAHGFAEVFSALFHGDFEGAKDAAEKAFNGIAGNAGAAFKNIVESAMSTRDSLGDVWSNIGGPKVKDSGRESGGTETIDAPQGKSGKGSDAAARRAAAEQKRALKEAYDAQMEAFRGEEQAAKGHWEQIIEIQRRELAAAVQMYGEGSKQAIAAQNRILESERQLAAEHGRLEDMKAEATRNMAIARINIEEQTAEARQQIGMMSEMQLLTMAAEFENQRHAIQLEGLQFEADRNAERVESHAQTLLQMEELNVAHHGRLVAIANQSAIASAAPIQQMWDTIGNGFANTAMGMMNHTMTLRQGMGQIFQQLAQQFIQMETMKLINFVRGQGAMTSANLAGNAIRAAADMAAAKQSMAATAMAAVKGIMNKAYEIFASVYNALASIPYVGPIIAPIAAAAAVGVVIGYAGKVSSAEGGFDIPAGSNPMTQLHEKEMVLPAKHADVIRGMADEGGGSAGAGGRGDTFHVTVQAHDARGVERLFKDNGALMADVLRRHFANSEVR